MMMRDPDHLYIRMLPPRGGNPAKLDHMGSVVMNGVGRVLVDARDRVLEPASDVHGDRLLECFYGDAVKLVRRMDMAERAASEAFGPGKWHWVLHTSYYVTPGCES